MRLVPLVLAALALLAFAAPTATAHADGAPCQSGAGASADRLADLAFDRRKASFDRAIALIEGPAPLKAAEAQVDRVWFWHGQYQEWSADAAAHDAAC